MKNVFFSLVILLSFLNTELIAQTEKGNWLLGGSGSFNRNKYSSQLQLNPKVGYFIVKNLAVGLDLSYFRLQSVFKDKAYEMIGVGTFLRYYFLGNERGKFFTEASYSVSKYISENTWTNYYNAGLGYSYFINKNVALEIGANIGQGKNTPLQFGFNFGFQIHL